MKLDPVVKKETGFIAVSAGICTALVQGIFLVIGRWDWTVLVGGAVGWWLTVGNFFLMSRDVQRAVEQDDAEQAKLRMKASYTWRMFLILGMIVVSFLVPWMHWVPVMAAVFYPRVAIAVRQIWENKHAPAQQEIPAAAPAEDEEEESEDEFEKMVSGFGKNAVAKAQAKKTDNVPKEREGK